MGVPLSLSTGRSAGDFAFVFKHFLTYGVEALYLIDTTLALF